MSGLCGWMGGAALDERALIATMAAPLARFDKFTPQLAHGRRGAAAVVASAEAAHVASHDGVIVAVWGRPVSADAELARAMDAAGLAAALARAWPCDPQRLCAGLGGSFALAILDEVRGEAVLAVDRMAGKPLIWQLNGETLVFGSSADAMRRHPAAPAALDPQSLYNYVYFHMVPSPGSIYQGQQRLLPGEFLHYRQGRVSTGSYWRMQFEETRELPFDQLREQFLGLLRSGVRDATAGDVKVGAFLSGGTDSSTLAGVLCEVGGRPADTYSIGFEAQGYDEMEYARLASRHFGTSHHEYYVTPDDVVAAIPLAAQICDQPCGNASVIPAYYCAKLAAADGVSHMLGGDGGDELFGGNERYAKQRVFAHYERVPQLLRTALLEPAIYGWPGRGRLASKARSYIEQAKLGMPARLESYNLLGRYGAAQVFTDAFLAEVDSTRPLAELQRTYGRSDAATLINRMLALDFQVTLADNDLPKVMRACELAGVTAAFPFLDDRMVAFSATLSPRQKLNGSQLRWFFKQALKGFLPEEIITKQKHGFGLPFGVWLGQHPALLALARDSLSDLRGRQIVRADFIDDLLNTRLREHAGYHGTMVWVLMMLEQWFRQREGAAAC
ncbi:asparagine synthase-related protein [Rugamonas sp.]|uniref:asparagine synthetase B family protein n=1 Tax=Rugamonas sp. TaxID=1926287 RepID=UPI0025DDF35A|nr:asparagine synthase-related protein [Rugamonas sp.]